MKKILASLLVSLISLSSPVYAERITLVDGNGNEVGTEGNPIKVSGSSSGGVSDDAYGAGWNGVTDVAPSKNAVYDKVETIVAGGLDFALDSSSSGNIRYVGCSDNVADAITAASAGDALEFGNCTYPLSAGLTVAKALEFIFQPDTIFDFGSTADVTGITITADNVTLRNPKFRGTDVDIGALVNCTGGTVCNNVNFINPDFNLSRADAAISGAIRYEDAGGKVVNPIIITSNYGTGTQQVQGIFKKIVSTAEADTTLYIFNPVIRSTNTNASFTGQHRGIMNWNNGADESTQSTYMYVYNPSVTTIPASSSSTEDTEALQSQGARVYTYTYGGVFDGSSSFAPGHSAGPEDARCDNGAICYIQGTIFSRGLTTSSGGGSYDTAGIFFADGIQQSGTPHQAPRHLVGEDIINLIGYQGGDKPGTGSQTGLVGSDAIITTGAGGAATEATTTGTGGPGGAFTFTSGAGGAQTTTSSTTNVGGAGGSISLIGGVGGVANGASTTNTGGRGASLFFAGGDGGVGTTTTGDAGTVTLGGTSATVSKGFVQLNLPRKTIAADDTTPDVRYSSNFVTSANTGATAITDLDNPTVGQVIIIMGGSDTSSSTIADSGNFNLSGAMTLNRDDMIALYVWADNDYIEMWRVNN